MKKLITGLCFLTLLLTGCSSNSNSSELTPVDLPLPTVNASDCNREFGELTLKMINRNPTEYMGLCGVLEIEVFNTNTGMDCAVQAWLTQLKTGTDGIFFFNDCKDAYDVFEGDKYKVSIKVDGTVSMVNNFSGNETITPSFTVYEVVPRV